MYLPAKRHAQNHSSAMRPWQNRERGISLLIRWLIIAVCVNAGCTPRWYRRDADQETYQILKSKTADPRWFVPQASIDPHPHSRFADPFDPDRPPHPPDDPTAHVDMHRPGGMRGYAHWHRDGDAPWIESPVWREYLDLSEDGTLSLTRDRAIELGLLNSRDYQLKLEDLYLTCLTLSFERYEFSLQWSFSNFTQFLHYGTSSTPGETNSLTTTTGFGFSRALVTGGQLMADFSNAFVWQYAGTDSLGVQSNIAVTLIQPLLRDAGRNIRLESLTQSERNVLYAARDFARFRKQFYFNVVSGDNGFLSLLLLVQNIRNFEVNLASLELDLRTHEALADAGIISRNQVDQVFQSYQSGRLTLVRARNDLQTALDTYKILLGLPPTLPVTLDDSLLRPFELTDPSLVEIEQQLDRLLAHYRELEVVPEVPQLRSGFGELEEFHPRVKELVDQIAAETESAKTSAPADNSAEEQSSHAYRVTTLQQAGERLVELRQELAKLHDAIQRAATEVAEAKRPDDWELLQKLIRQQLSIVSELYVIQTRVRAYHVELTIVDMTQEQAVQIALENRLDVMNKRAAVVDAWRRIQITANQLKSDLDVEVGANVGTEPDSRNPFDFSAAGSSYQASLRFDGPLNRKSQRNAYRAQLINYQRARRDFMAAEDVAVQAARRDIRDLSTNKINFEISRESLIAAARQVEMSRDQLLLPGPASDSSSTQDTLIALNSLLQAKNSLISIWVAYETARLQLLLDIEAIQPDPSREPSHEYLYGPDGLPAYEELPPAVGTDIPGGQGQP